MLLWRRFGRQLLAMIMLDPSVRSCSQGLKFDQQMIKEICWRGVVVSDMVFCVTNTPASTSAVTGAFLAGASQRRRNGRRRRNIDCSS